jgi:two-component system CheB/CheR fusion protein
LVDETVSPASPEQPRPDSRKKLLIVAVGASAGGLDALRAFFGSAELDLRLCFVVVTHLPAHHVSYLSELLARAGVLPASEAQAGQRLAGGHVYVMPPGKLMALRGGVVCFDELTPGVRVPAPKPIDFFMASVAEDVGDDCVGVVLSGTDHDGTLGLKAIKAAGGCTLVQTPTTAEFPGMPKSAIDAGLADHVLAPEAMFAVLQNWLDRQPVDDELDPAAPVAMQGADALNDILDIVLARTGNDFRWYRPAMLRRRLRRRMVLMGCDRVADYLHLLQDSREEAAALSSEFLIGVTDFFRDPEAWPELEAAVRPLLQTDHEPDAKTFRAWTPGCSSGEESYSVAMLLLELNEGYGLRGAVQVFGTDIDHDALAAARRGAYVEAIASTVSPARLARFFDHRGDRFVVRKALREAVMFAPQNLVRDTPFSRLDLVCCRNVLMYFEPALQDQVLRLFHFALKPGGLLWLGKAESLGRHGALFEPVSRTDRLFRRLPGRSHLPRGFAGLRKNENLQGWQPGAPQRQAPASEILRNHLQGRAVTAAVLCDRNGRAMHFHGDCSRFFTLNGDATLELARLVRSELRAALRTVLRQVFSDEQVAARRVILGVGRQAQPVTLQAEPAAGLPGVAVIVFSDALGAPPSSAEAAAESAADATSIELEIDANRRELALALEDAEYSNEELRIAGEEASALNEELQSSNEELESSKEELQSLNEELATVNAQLEDKVIEIGRSADDLANLLESTHIATLLLDGGLRLRRFTPAAATLFSLRAGDEGRLLSDVSSRVDDPAFAADVQAVLQSQRPAEAEVRTSGGATFLRRIQPYVLADAGVEGLVVTFVDITPLQAAERQVRKMMAVLEDSNDAVITYDLEGRILSWNQGAQAAYGYQRDEALATTVFALVPEADRDAARQLISRVSTSGGAQTAETNRRAKDGRLARISMAVSALRDDQGAVYALLSTERDITERLRAESEMRFRRLADDIPTLLRVEDGLGMAEFVNQACTRFTGRPSDLLLGRGWLEFVHPQDRERYLVEHAAAQAEHVGFEIDLRLQRHDGVYRWMRSISVPHLGDGGSFEGSVALMLDVEDRKRFETELLTASQHKDEFVAMLAHELRNPLAPIRSAVSILSRVVHGDQRAEWSVGVIRRQTEILTRLLDGLLDMARISSGKTVLELAPVELQVVADRAIEISQPLIDSRRQTLQVAIQAGLFVEGDLIRLTQVLANLLNNAAKYTDEGGVVHLGIEHEGDEAVISVRDDGAGLSAEMLPRVFDLFAQADTTLDRAKGGLGLGLTLVRQLVQLHKGSVDVVSPGLGKGSTFTVRLPLLQRGPRAPVAQTAAPAQAAARRILVVDDNVDGAQALACLLELEGHQVVVAYDGPAALVAAETSGPDVVLLDIGLPSMDGYQVARRLRGMSATATALIVAMTGYGQPEDVAAALSAGFDRHLVKPVDPAALMELVAGAPRRA